MYVGYGQSFANKVGPYILPINRTHSHNAFIPVDVLLCASDCLSTDQIAECIGCHLPAAIGFTRCVVAKLFALGRIDAKQAEPLAVNVNCVAINNRGDPHISCVSVLVAVVFASLSVVMTPAGIQFASMSVGL